MICEKCNSVIDDDSKYCPSCGNKIGSESKVYDVFANVGYGVGIGTFIASFFTSSFLYLGIAALVFSCLGKKSEKNYKNAEKGFKFALAGLIIQAASVVLAFAVIFFYIFYFLILIAIAGSSSAMILM